MKRIYGIFDRIAKELIGRQMYMLMCFRTDQEAARYFADAINDKSSMLNKHPGDYELVLLGHIEEDNLSAPLLTAENQYTIIITGDTLVALQAGDIPNNAHTPINA